MEWRAGLCPDAHHIFGDETSPRTLLQIVEGIGVRLVAVGGGNGCARSRTCDLDVPCSVGFTDASVLLEEGEADCTLAECFTECICDFGGGGGGRGGENHHRAMDFGLGSSAPCGLSLCFYGQSYEQFLNYANFSAPFIIKSS